ncbi:MAG: dihydroorotase [Candidatus Ranarchaeia archaeon]
MVDLKIQNCKIYVASNIFSGGIAIDEGRIVAIGKNSNLPKADTVIDAKGNYVLPGIVDPHSHLGHSPTGSSFEEWKATVYRQMQTETVSAAAGGVTTLFTLIGQGEKIPFEVAINKVEQNALVDMAFHIGIGSTEHLEAIQSYVDAGITSFKFHMVEYPNFRVSAADDGLIFLGLEKIRGLGTCAVPMFHCENLSLYKRLKEVLKSQGRTGLTAWADSRPNFSEEEAMRKVIFFAETLQTRLYIVHMSIKEGVTLIAKAKNRGVNVVAETCPHYLTLTTSESDELTRKINPPLREKEDINALWTGIRHGVIDCVGSDHVVAMKESQLALGLWDAHNVGFAGTEMILPVMLSEGVNQRQIPLGRIVEICSQNPAKVFGIYPQKGIIQIGADADLVVVDLKKEVKVTNDVLHSESDYTVYENRTFKGWPILTLVRGTVVAENGEITGKPGHGHYLRRSLSNTPNQIV